MRKIVIAMAAILAIIRLPAQTIDSIPHHNLGNGTPSIESLMEMSDGSIVSCVILGPTSTRVKIQKVNRDPELALADSLVHYTTYSAWSICAKDPQNYNKGIFTEFKEDTENGGCKVDIRRFNGHLVFDPDEINVHVADDFSLLNSGVPGMLIDPLGDLVMTYYNFDSIERNFIRIGLDGNIKHQATLTAMTLDGGTDCGPFIVSESPLTYCYIGQYYANYQHLTKCYLLDSLFNITESITLPDHSEAPLWLRYYPIGALEVCGKNDGSLLLAMPYGSMNPQVVDQGLAILKYDGYFTLKKKFNSEPYMQGMDNCAIPIGMDWSKDGNLYLAYSTNSLNGYVSVVKMDSDFNVIWERYCMEPRQLYAGKMMILKENKVAVVGISIVNNSSCDAFYIVVNDDYDSLEETDSPFRPYAYWPNPAQDELHLQYSPDVKPTRVELYDLQGCMISRQTDGLERVNLRGLASGQYLMKVTLQDGKSYMDRVMKE